MKGLRRGVEPECQEVELMPLLPATLGVENADSSNPPQVMSPNVGEEQVHDTLSASRLLPEDESQSRIKEERKEKDVTPKSEAATAGIKEEPASARAS